MIGRFHELSLSTDTIRSSAEFFERLRFTHATTNDTWPHPYGVLTDGAIFIGIHERRMPSPALSFVLPDLASRVHGFESHGVRLTERHLGSEEFNYLGLSDPGGQAIRLLEARTYSPPGPDIAGESLCGHFEAISFPEADPARAAQFWRGLGFVPVEAEDRAWPCERLEGGGLRIELHRSRTLDLPMLIFSAHQMDARLDVIRELGFATDAGLPRGLDPGDNLLLEAPAGLGLLMLGSAAPAD